MTKVQKILILFALIITPLLAHAQNGVNSPYSRYGFGLLSDRSMGFNRAMGGVAQGFRNGQEINTANPASYSSADSLTALFDLGMTVQNGNYSMGKQKQNIKNSSFDYAAYSFRATRGVGIAFALMPYSKIKYSFASDPQVLQNNAGLTSSYSYTGDGGLRQVMLGAGWQFIKPLSIGLNVGYLWGEYEHNMTMSYSSTSAYSIKRTYSANISTFTLEGGIQYSVNLSKKDRLTLGATGVLGHKVHNNAYRTTSTTNTSSSTVEASAVDTLKNAFQLPHCISVGATYYLENKLRVGIDFELQRWSRVQFPVVENYEQQKSTGNYTPTYKVLNDRIKIAAGAEYRPDALGRSFFKRLAYKMGGYYSRSYANVNESGIVTSKKPTEFGLSAGVTIPIQNRNLFYSSPKINVTFSWVHTNIPYYLNSSLNGGSTPTLNTLKENYLRLSVGLTLSERWFYKWKVQ
ncbi:MAG: hypothetical protein IJV06_03330 [Bacteroidaceae bacterium]|nr:hypothetical protein [Bacteroidaceae bacterium]